MTRLTRLLGLLAYLLLTPLADAGEGDTKPTKKIVRAADGLDIVCEVRGQGEPALIFLHGWCGERVYWKHQVEAFAASHRVVTLDQAGHGESGKNRESWKVSGLAGDVEAVVKALGLKRVILVGHSMGGPVALVAAKRLPGTVVAVVGVDTLQKEAKTPVRCINSAGGFAFFTPTDVAVNKKYADYDAVTIDAVGHYPMLEKPAEFNKKLREVLKEFTAKK